MPRNVRNFWIELNVDGRTPIAAGPVARDGGFELTVKQRDKGGILYALTVRGYADDNGGLVLWAEPDGEAVSSSAARDIRVACGRIEIKTVR